MFGTGSSSCFAFVLNSLCENPAGQPGRITNAELAERVRALGGDITSGYISHLRTGLRDNPTLHTVEHLAAALDVCPAVFVGGRRERHGRERPRLTFSNKLRRLFASVHPVERGPYTPEEVAQSISGRGTYGSISASYIRELLNPAAGAPPNPRLKHVLGLAAHFGLADDSGPQAALFLDDEFAETVFAELADYVALRDAGVVEFVTRMSERASQWTPSMRRQAMLAFKNAMEADQSVWVFPPRKGAFGA